MSEPNRLELYAPRDASGDRAALPTLPTPVPQSLAGALDLVNDAFLLAEASGLPIESAAERVDEVAAIPHPLPRIFLDEDLHLLSEVAAAAAARLVEAVDEAGELVGSEGDRLGRETFIRTNVGPPAFRSSSRTLAERRYELAALDAMLRFAVEHDLLVRLT